MPDDARMKGHDDAADSWMIGAFCTTEQQVARSAIRVISGETLTPVWPIELSHSRK